MVADSANFLVSSESNDKGVVCVVQVVQVFDNYIELHVFQNLVLFRVRV
mgnify:CR=1 FL=1